MLTAIALDDETPALEIIETFASRSKLVDLKASFSKTTAARQYLAENPVDLLFLDIQMPAISGIDFAKSIPKDIIVIFTTSFSNYAVESYSLDAVDYLLKPFSFQRFEQALGKAHEIYNARHPDAAHGDPIVLKANYGLVKIWPGDILFIEGLDNYLKIHLRDQLQVVRLTLKEMTEKLPAEDFLRVHRSFIIALKEVRFVRNKTIHIGDQEIPLGGKYEAEFQQRFHPED